MLKETSPLFPLLFFCSYLASIRWAGEQRSVEIIATGLQPLVGRALLQGYLVSINFREGGDILLEANS